MSQMKEEVNTFHMTPNTNIFINKIVDFESQSPYYPNAPRRLPDLKFPRSHFGLTFSIVYVPSLKVGICLWGVGARRCMLSSLQRPPRYVRAAGTSDMNGGCEAWYL